MLLFSAGSVFMPQFSLKAWRMLVCVWSNGAHCIRELIFIAIDCNSNHINATINQMHHKTVTHVVTHIFGVRCISIFKPHQRDHAIAYNLKPFYSIYSSHRYQNSGRSFCIYFCTRWHCFLITSLRTALLDRLNTISGKKSDSPLNKPVKMSKKWHPLCRTYILPRVICSKECIFSVFSLPQAKKAWIWHSAIGTPQRI